MIPGDRIKLKNDPRNEVWTVMIIKGDYVTCNKADYYNMQTATFHINDIELITF